jgi:hypothetical protein
LSSGIEINRVIITFSILLAALIIVLNGGFILAIQQPSFRSEALEEIRENVMEVRLALQKGDLIEALQHLNNVDEDLLLLETEFQRSNSASTYDNSSSSTDSNSSSWTPEASGGVGINSSNYDYAELGQNDTHSENKILSISNNALNVDSSNKTSSSPSSLESESSNDSIRKLNVTFNSIFINDNHDILFPAEWQLDAYVNNKRIQLSDNFSLDRVESGQAIKFSDKSVALEVPENGTLRIITVGAELDEGVVDSNHKVIGSSVEVAGHETGGGVLPDIAGILDTEAPLPEYKDKAEDSIQFLTTYDRNDAIGMIATEYDARNNFGIGDHFECSESTGEVGDIFDTVDTNCDYRLSYTIEEI